MSFIFNPTKLAVNQLVTNKLNFINTYGASTMNYDRLTATGEQKYAWFYFIPVLTIITTIILFAKSVQKVDENNNPIERTTIEKTLRILAWISLIICVLSLIYSGYMYLFMYLPQYNKWFNELPIDAKQQLKMINSLESVATFNYSNRSKISNNAGLFNIRL